MDLEIAGELAQIGDSGAPSAVGVSFLTVLGLRGWRRQTPVTPLEEALEEERTQLMLANSMLGCLQVALDPEAITVTPPVYFPEVL